MNAQKRRMRELEHKREVERLWQEKLAVYRVERDKELEEQRKKVEEQKWKDEVVRREKRKTAQSTFTKYRRIFTKRYSPKRRRQKLFN